MRNHYYPKRLRSASCLCLLALASWHQGVHAQFALGGSFLEGLLQPGTPAVATYPTTTAAPDSTGGWLGALTGGLVNTQPAAAAGSQAGGGLFGWLFPVYTTTRRNNCVVYEGSGNENLRQVSDLFGLSYTQVLQDNQGVVGTPNEPLAGRSVLLCGTQGRRPRPIQAPAATPSRPRPAAPPAAAPRPANAPTPTAVRPLVSPALQKRSLLMFKGHVNPKGQVLKDWNNKVDHCTWVYVTCDANKNIVRLNMVYLGLEGKLPPGPVMRNLPHLTHIYLGGNLLKGPLPADWGNIVKPIELFLNDNLLSGPLPPSWGNMRTLKVLSLPYNQLTGRLPPSWGMLTNLEILKLNNNKLVGSVPQEWSRMREISTVTIFNNQQMAGCVPEPWSGKGKSGQGYFQSPSGALSSNVKDATHGTSIDGYCCKGWRYCV